MGFRYGNKDEKTMNRPTKDAAANPLLLPINKEDIIKMSKTIILNL